VAGALSGGDFIRMPGIEREISRPIVQNNAGVSRHHPGAENVGDAGDEGNRIPVPVDHGKIGRISENMPCGAGRNRLVHSNERAPRSDERIAEQLFDIHLAKTRVADVALRVGKTEFQRIEDQVLC
jgi:hypothetical protein